VESFNKKGMIFNYMVGGFLKGNIISRYAYDERCEWIMAEVKESDGTKENFLPECTIALNYDDDHICKYGKGDKIFKTFEESKQRIFESRTILRQDTRYPSHVAFIQWQTAGHVCWYWPYFVSHQSFHPRNYI
jgi:UDP-N-acetylmuramate-alanine ligase